MIIFCGFNGYSQYKSFETSKNQETLKLNVIEEFTTAELFDFKCNIILSWSNVVIISDDYIKISGFILGDVGPVTIEKPFQDSVIQGSCGKRKCYFVSSNGKCWEYDLETALWRDISRFLIPELDEELEKNVKIIKICHSETLTVALTNTGLTYCLPNALTLPGIFVVNVECGKEHGILLTDKGSVYTWGGGSRGQLGGGGLESSERPHVVEALSGLNVVKISAGGWHCAVITDQGDLYTWGWNNQGQLGHSRQGGVTVVATPLPVDLPEHWTVVDVSCGASHTIIKLSTGEILGCGWNKWGQLGLKGQKDVDKLTLLPLPEPDISVGRIICAAWSSVLLCESFT